MLSAVLLSDPDVWAAVVRAGARTAPMTSSAGPGRGIGPLHFLAGSGHAVHGHVLPVARYLLRLHTIAIARVGPLLRELAYDRELRRTPSDHMVEVFLESSARFGAIVDRLEADVLARRAAAAAAGPARARRCGARPSASARCCRAPTS